MSKSEHPMPVIPIQPFTEEAWSPFGWVPVDDSDDRDGEHRLHFDLDDAHVNIISHSTDELPTSSEGFLCEKFFRHATHTQVLMSLDNSCVVGVAPPNTDFSQSNSIETVRAFCLRPLEPVVLFQGTWHWGPYPSDEEEVRLFNVQGHGFAGDNEMADLASLGLVLRFAFALS
ncbi:MAG: hypothetical protein F2903_04465 [Actinobacteria bacterium]|jgi:hypothetical protein|nr:hypothetical protein [Actinomycetota bacterium]MSX10390.1 hypothetical protein [Actinomycetota bacterium]MSX68336.1 hypothetical protein [Actinomycetota bacterium]